MAYQWSDDLQVTDDDLHTSLISYTQLYDDLRLVQTLYHDLHVTV